MRTQQEAEARQTREQEVNAARETAEEAAATKWRLRLGEVQQSLQREKQQRRAKAQRRPLAGTRVG